MSVGGAVARGAAWMVGFKLIERSLGVLSILILARLLLPQDFGLVAMATVTVGAIELLGSFGFDMALIQKQDAGRSQYDTAWSILLLFSLSAATALALLAQPAAAFYGEPRLAEIIWWLALGTAIQGFDNIGVVAFRKELRLDLEFRFLLARRLTTFTVTVICAYLLRTYWALVVGIVTGRVLGVTLSYLMHAYRPRFNLAAWREMLHFSKWMMLSNFLLFINNRAADFVLGKAAGPHAVGVFSMSFEISNLPTTELGAPINRAVYPGYAKLGDDVAALRRGFVQVLGVIALFGFPAALGIAALAEPMVLLFLGDRWGECIPLMRVLAFYGALMVLHTNSLYVYVAQGKPRFMTLAAGLQAGIALPLLILWSGPYGAMGAAYALIVTAAILLPTNYAILMRTLQLPFTGLASALWRAVLVAGGMYALVRGLDGLLSGQALALRVALGVACGALSYTAGIGALWWLLGKPDGAETWVLGKASGVLGRLFRRGAGPAP